MNTLESFSLNGKVVLLTGGAGLYGHGLASQVAEAGATLVLASRNTEALAKVAASETARGYSVIAESLDQGNEGSILALRDRLVSRFGRIDGLINNAVLRPMRNPDSPLSTWEESMKVNATGLFALSRAVGDVMAKSGGGSIVNISSIMGIVGPNFSNYEGTGMTTVPDYFFHKGGMISLTHYFASLYGPAGVRVNCVSPGGYFTGQDPVFVDRYNKCTMLGRMAGDRDLGGAIVFLLSDASSYITAVNLPVDAGYTAK